MKISLLFHEIDRYQRNHRLELNVVCELLRCSHVRLSWRALTDWQDASRHHFRNSLHLLSIFTGALSAFFTHVERMECSTLFELLLYELSLQHEKFWHCLC
jgi:hypothetical protein